MTGPVWRNFDPILLVASLALTGYGALLIYSASLPRGSENIVISGPVVRHIAAAGAGVIVMFAAARINYRILDVAGWLAYGLGLVLLAGVLLVGSDEFGARRWYDLGFTLVQASEIAKILTIIGLAKFISDSRGRMNEWSIFLTSLGLAVLPALLVFVEPDAGSASVFLILWAVMAAFGGVRPRRFLILGLTLIALLPLGILAGVQDYQRDRIRVFLDPTTDIQGAGFNIQQAETSVGSGGLLGKGLTHGTQTQLDFLRTQTTDFIFSVLAEELGFAGAMALFALLLLVILRGLRAITRSTDPFGRLLVVGIITLIAVQSFINIGVNIRILPVTGIPLPFISVGNSSLMVLFLALGIVQSVLIHRDVRR